MENSNEKSLTLASSSSSRQPSQSAKKSHPKVSVNKSNPFLETTLGWLKSFTPKKLQEYDHEESHKKRKSGGSSSAETLIKKKKILTMHADVATEHQQTLNLYEAFGTTAKKTAPGSGFQPVLVVEVNENGMLKRHLVPYKYSMEGKWLLYGKHIYVLKGHSFIEHKSSPTFVSCVLCLTTGFRMTQNFFQCMDCEYVCHTLQETTVTKDCPVAKILSQEMDFPYDVIETKTEKVHYL